MVALLRNTALCASVLSKNGTVYWGMPDLVLSVGSDVNKLCDVGWMTWESVSASEQRGSESITWHCGEVSELTCVKDLVTSLSLASRVGHCEKLWVLGVCVCVCVCAHTCMCATGQGFAAQKELTPMRLMNCLVEHEGYRAALKSTALEWDRPGFHSEFHCLPALWQFLSSCVTSLPQFPYLTHKGSSSTHLTE